MSQDPAPTNDDRKVDLLGQIRDALNEISDSLATIAEAATSRSPLGRIETLASATLKATGQHVGNLLMPRWTRQHRSPFCCDSDVCWCGGRVAHQRAEDLNDAHIAGLPEDKRRFMLGE
jgi:hypothetical protein